VDISTRLLPEDVPEIDANTVTFYDVWFGDCLTSLQTTVTKANLQFSLGIQKLKDFQP